MIRTSSRLPFLQVVKTAVAAILAWFAASAVFPQQIPVFAAIAALLVVQPSVNQSFGKAVERSLGVLVGVLVALGAVLVFGDPSWLVLAAIVASLFVAWALRLTPGGSVQIPISAMLVLTIGAATPTYAAARVTETIIGAAVGLLVNAAIVPPQLIAPARLAVLRLGHSLADVLDRLAGGMTGDTSRAEVADILAAARALRPLRESATAALQSGRESLALNPRRSRYRTQLEADIDLLARFDPLVTQVIHMTRSFHDHWAPSLRDEPALAGIAEEVRRAAHDLRLLVDRTDESRTDEQTALTSPLTILRPSPDNWVLIGALLEDLRRVRGGIVSDESDTSGPLPPSPPAR
jgi:uncharacterized membrane protein YgaE (UPF0421/DUF939 family)